MTPRPGARGTLARLANEGNSNPPRRAELFVDISSTAEQKRAAIHAHVCQNPDCFYPYHVKMEQERGSEANLKRAEAFVVVQEKLPKPCMPFTV